MDIEKLGRTVAESAATKVAGDNAAKWVGNVNKEIDLFSSEVKRAFTSSKTNLPKNTPTAQIKGNFAEHYAAGTYNINAAINETSETMFVNESTKFGSVDITGSEGSIIGSKYSSVAEHSARFQTISYLDRWRLYNYNHKESTVTIDEYCAMKSISPDTVLTDAIYKGQLRLVPADQIPRIQTWFNQKISDPNMKPEDIERLKETLSNIIDCIKTKDGTESIPLTADEAYRLAELAKKMDFDPRKEGISTEELIERHHILKKGFNAGMKAAIVAFAIASAKAIVQSLIELNEKGYIDKETLIQFVYSSGSSSLNSFLSGSVTASLAASCASGKLGAALKNVSPSWIAAGVVVCISSIKGGVKLANGEISKAEFANNIANTISVTGASFIGGAFGQLALPIPILGYTLGSIVGSVVATFMYDKISNRAMAFYVDSGFTLFGLVDQNYEIPVNILKEIGVEVFEYEKFEYDDFKMDEFIFEEFEYEQFEYEQFRLSGDNNSEFTFTPLRRGVIGFGKIGYV